MKTIRTLGAAAVAAGLVTLAGCASTSFKSTWKAPDAAPVAPEGKKVVAVAVFQEPSRRRAAEEVLAAEIRQSGAEAIPSYTLLGDDELQDKEAAKAVLVKAGVEGVVVMRLVGVDQKISQSPGMWYADPYYGSFSGYWGYGWGAAYVPGTITTNTYVQVETMVYSLTQDKLLWAGVTETVDPTRTEKAVGDIARRVSYELRRSKLVEKGKR